MGAQIESEGMSFRIDLAQAIYHAAFSPATHAERARQVPSPGWLWDKASPAQHAFCLRQADAAIDVMRRRGMIIPD